MKRSMFQPLYILLTVCLLLTCVTPAWFHAAAAAGDTADDPIILSSAAELKDLAPDKHYKIDASLTELDMTGITDFEPISLTTGSFDGSNVVIKNLNVQKQDSSNAALFDSIGAGAVVKNVYVIDSAFIGEKAGFMCSLSGKLESCGFAGSVNGEYYAGGLVFEILEGASIVNCYTVPQMSQGGKSGIIAYEAAENAKLEITYSKAFADGVTLINWDNADMTKVKEFAIADQTVKVGEAFTVPYTDLPGVTATTTVQEADADKVTIAADSKTVTGKAVGTAQLTTVLAFGSNCPVTLTYQMEVQAAETEKLQGAGTQASPYLIKKASDLLLMKEVAYYKVDSSVQELDLSSYSNWTPIELTKANEAAGGFDGNGAVIRGLKINASANDTLGRYGLFGGLGGDGQNESYPFTISNVVLADVDISVAAPAAYVGGLVGDGRGVVIQSCAVSGTVQATGANAVVGGLAGRLVSAENAVSSVSASFVYGTVSGATAGGLVGQSTAAGETHGKISNCYFRGDMKNSTSAAGLSNDSVMDIERSYTVASFTSVTHKAALAINAANAEPVYTNCVYDNTVAGSQTGVADAAYTLKTDEYGKFVGMTTELMTNNWVPARDSIWIAKDATDRYYYYPQLWGFTNGKSAVAALSLESVTYALPITPEKALELEAQKYRDTPVTIARNVRSGVTLTNTIIRLKRLVELNPDVKLTYRVDDRAKCLAIDDKGDIYLANQQTKRGDAAENVYMVFTYIGETTGTVQPLEVPIAVTIQSNYVTPGSGGTGSGTISGTYRPNAGTPAPTPDVPSITTPQPPAVVGGDVPAAHWAKGSIDKMITRGIIKGDEGTGNVRPTENIKREEVAALLLRAMGKEIQSGGVLQAGDPSSAWAADTLYTAQLEGIMNGDDMGNFNGQNSASRAQVVAMLARARGLSSDNVAILMNFADSSSIPDWARPAVAALVEQELLSGYEDNTLRMGNDITRAETFALIDRLLLNE